MKHYVGQMISMAPVQQGFERYDILGVIIDNLLYHYDSKANIIRVHSLLAMKTGEFMEIELDEDGNPACGKFLEREKAVNLFHQLIHDLRKDNKVGDNKQDAKPEIVTPKLSQFCRYCGAHIPPRTGEGTCHESNPARAQRTKDGFNQMLAGTWPKSQR